MLSVTLQGVERPAEKMSFKAPSGRSYVWDKPEPPTQADIDAIIAHEKSLVEEEKRAKKPAPKPAPKSAPQSKGGVKVYHSGVQGPPRPPINMDPRIGPPRPSISGNPLVDAIIDKDPGLRKQYNKLPKSEKDALRKTYETAVSDKQRQKAGEYQELIGSGDPRLTGEENIPLGPTSPMSASQMFRDRSGKLVKEITTTNPQEIFTAMSMAAGDALMLGLTLTNPANVESFSSLSPQERLLLNKQSGDALLTSLFTALTGPLGSAGKLIGGGILKKATQDAVINAALIELLGVTEYDAPGTALGPGIFRALGKAVAPIIEATSKKAGAAEEIIQGLQNKSFSRPEDHAELIDLFKKHGLEKEAKNIAEAYLDSSPIIDKKDLTSVFEKLQSYMDDEGAAKAVAGTATIKGGQFPTISDDVAQTILERAPNSKLAQEVAAQVDAQKATQAVPKSTTSQATVPKTEQPIVKPPKKVVAPPEIPVKPKRIVSEEVLKTASAERKTAFEQMQFARAKQAKARKGKQSGGYARLLPEEIAYAKAYIKEKDLKGAAAVEDFIRHVGDELGENVGRWKARLAKDAPDLYTEQPVKGPQKDRTAKQAPGAVSEGATLKKSVIGKEIDDLGEEFKLSPERRPNEQVIREAQKEGLGDPNAALATIRDAKKSGRILNQKERAGALLAIRQVLKDREESAAKIAKSLAQGLDAATEERWLRYTNEDLMELVRGVSDEDQITEVARTLQFQRAILADTPEGHVTDFVVKYNRGRKVKINPPAEEVEEVRKAATAKQKIREQIDKAEETIRTGYSKSDLDAAQKLLLKAKRGGDLTARRQAAKDLIKQVMAKHKGKGLMSSFFGVDIAYEKLVILRELLPAIKELAAVNAEELNLTIEMNLKALKGEFGDEFTEDELAVALAGKLPAAEVDRKMTTLMQLRKDASDLLRTRRQQVEENLRNIREEQRRIASDASKKAKAEIEALRKDISKLEAKQAKLKSESKTLNRDQVLTDVATEIRVKKEALTNRLNELSENAKSNVSRQKEELHGLKKDADAYRNQLRIIKDAEKDLNKWVKEQQKDFDYAMRKERIAEIKARINAIRASAKGEEALIANRIERKVQQIEEANKDLAEGVFRGWKSRRKFDSPELRRLRIEEAKLNRRLHAIKQSAEYRAEMAGRTNEQVFWDQIRSVVNARRIMASYDFSAGTNQLSMAMWTDFKSWKNGAIDAFRSSWKNEGYENALATMQAHNRWDAAEASGLVDNIGELQDIYGEVLGSEQWFYKLPGSIQTQRHYDLWTRRTRLEMFDTWATMVEMSTGRTLDLDDYKEIASTIKSLTGASDKGLAGPQVAKYASKFWFAWKFLVSRWETALMVPLMRAASYGRKTGNWGIFRVTARKYGEGLAKATGFVAIADQLMRHLSKDDEGNPRVYVEWNPAHALFGQLVIKTDPKTKEKVTIPVLPFQMQVYGMLYRIGSGTQISSNDRVINLSDDPKKFISEELWKITLGKASPIISFASSQLLKDETGKYFGEDVRLSTLSGIANNFTNILPFSLQNGLDTVSTETNLGEKAAIALLGLVANANVKPAQFYGLDVFPEKSKQGQKLLQLGIDVRVPERKSKPQDVQEGQRIVTKDMEDPRGKVDPEWFTKVVRTEFFDIMNHPEFQKLEKEEGGLLIQKQVLTKFLNSLKQAIGKEDFSDQVLKDRLADMNNKVADAINDLRSK